MKASTKINQMMVASFRDRRGVKQQNEYDILKQKEELRQDYASIEASTKFESPPAELQSRLSQFGSQESKRSKKQHLDEPRPDLRSMNSPIKVLELGKHRASNGGHPNFLKRQVFGKQTEVASPRVTSPKFQVDIIQYLQQQNKDLQAEMQRKNQMIKQLLGNPQPVKKMAKNTSVKQLYQQAPPKTVETQGNSEYTRLPQITTPQPQMKHRFDTQMNEANEFQVPNTYHLLKQTKPLVTNEQNWSFGQQLVENDTFYKSKSQFGKKLTQTNLKQKTPNLQIKANFTKPLLKLPQEFHLQSWNQIK